MEKSAPLGAKAVYPKKVSWRAWNPFVLSLSKREWILRTTHSVSILNPAHPSTGLRANSI
ncbi:MAG: hypothetical protein ACU84J_15195 [Gammaproteobacteria bacterium]